MYSHRSDVAEKTILRYAPARMWPVTAPTKNRGSPAAGRHTVRDCDHGDYRISLPTALPITLKRCGTAGEQHLQDRWHPDHAARHRDGSNSGATAWLWRRTRLRGVLQRRARPLGGTRMLNFNSVLIGSEQPDVLA